VKDKSENSVGEGRESEQRREATAAVFRALENVDADVSPQLARAVQATINLIRRIGRDYGLLTGDEVRAALGLVPGDVLPFVFAVPYRGRIQYPAFLFERAPGHVDVRRVRSVVAELGRLADEYGWDGTDVVFWLVSPTTWFADGGLPVDHFDEPDRVLAAFDSAAGAEG
jgi:hypothetical protein